MKKIISLLLVSVFAIGLLAGCGATPAPASTDAATVASPAATTAAPAAADAAPTKITYWYYMESKEQQALLNTLIKNYNDSQKKVEVTAEYVPFADFKKQLSIGLAASKLPDIVTMDNPDMCAYSAMGLFADITDKVAGLKDQYFPGPWASTVYNGKNYGVPFGSNDLCLYYNTDMLTKAGVTPPTTWDELKVAAKKLTGNGVTGLGMSAVKNEEGTFQFMPWLLSTGATPDKVGSPEGIKAFALLADMIKDGSMSKEVINWVQSDVNKQFMTGKIAMQLNGPWQLPTIKAQAPDLKFDVVVVPKDKVNSSVLGGENWGVINGKNVDATLDFLNYVIKPDVLNTYIDKFGYIPSRKDAAADPKYTQAQYVKVFADEMQYAAPRGPSPKWPELSNAISTALQETLTLTKTPDQAAKDAQAKIDKIGK